MLKNFTLTFTTILLSFLFLKTADAQQRFKAGLVFGLNAAQIMGDDSGGYNKLGLHGGLRGIAVLKDKMELSMELLYAQRGSYQKEGNPKCYDGSMKIHLQYAEVPVLFTYKDWLDEEEGYYKVQASAGFSYGRLLSADAEGSCHDTVTGDFNTNDVSFTIGAEVFLSRHFSIGARWTRSLNLLFNHNQDPSYLGLNSLYGYFLSFRGAYIF